MLLSIFLPKVEWTFLLMIILSKPQKKRWEREKQTASFQKYTEKVLKELPKWQILNWEKFKGLSPKSWEKMEEYRERLLARGVDVTEIVNHDNSAFQMSKEVTDDVFVRSMYFFDPDGVMLEFAAWTRDLRPDEAEHTAATAADKDRYLAVQEQFAEQIAAAQSKNREK